MSTAYGQTGYGGTFEAGVGIPTPLGPAGHFGVSGSVTAAYPAHALVMIHRSQSIVWDDYYERPYQPPIHDHEVNDPLRLALLQDEDGSDARRAYENGIWQTHAPISLAHLTGRMWEVEGKAALDAYVGFGSAFSNSEAGIAVGAQIQGSAQCSHTEIHDNNVRHYGDHNLEDLKSDVILLLEHNIKWKIVAWMEVAAGGPSVFKRNLGLPFSDVMSQVDDNDPDGFDPKLLRALQKWMEHDEERAKAQAKTVAQNAKGPDAEDAVDEETAGLLSTAWAALKKAYNGGRSFVSKLGRDLSTLETHLKNTIDALNQFVVAAEQIDDDDEKARDNRIKLIANARRRIKEANALLATLTRVIEAKAAAKKPDAQHEPADAKGPTPTATVLKIDVAGGMAKASAGAQITLPKMPTMPWAEDKSSVYDQDQPEDEKNFTRALKLEKLFHSKRVAFRFQTHKPDPHSRERDLFAAQDTIVEYQTYRFDAMAGRDTSTALSDAEDPYTLRTLHYRSATATWFNNDQPHSGEALPNGSGVSFGLSVLVPRLMTYAVAVEGLPEDDAATVLGEVPQQIEDMLISQLKVTKPQLRRFGRTVPGWLREGLQFGDAFVIESAFAFDRHVPLDMNGDKVGNLLHLADAKNLLEGKPAAHTVLQSIRLRYRFKGEEDNSFSLPGIGLSPIQDIKDMIESAKSGVEKAKQGIAAFQKGVRSATRSAAYTRDIAAEFEEMAEAKGAATSLKTEEAPPGLEFGASINLERVKRVGHEGVFTVHEVFFPDRYDPEVYGAVEARRMADRNYRRDAELLVPPVQLFNQ